MTPLDAASENLILHTYLGAGAVHPITSCQMLSTVSADFVACGGRWLHQWVCPAYRRNVDLGIAGYAGIGL